MAFKVQCRPEACHLVGSLGTGSQPQTQWLKHQSTYLLVPAGRAQRDMGRVWGHGQSKSPGGPVSAVSLRMGRRLGTMEQSCGTPPRGPPTMAGGTRAGHSSGQGEELLCISDPALETTAYHVEAFYWLSSHESPRLSREDTSPPSDERRARESATVLPSLHRHLRGQWHHHACTHSDTSVRDCGTLGVMWFGRSRDHVLLGCGIDSQPLA